MADVVLKDINGTPVTYYGKKTLEVDTSDGGTQIYSEGTVAENLEPIELNFAEGNQTISAPDGMLIKSAIIQKPENLKPENIVKDVEIAGIIGTNEGGGGSFGEVDIFPWQTVEGFAQSADFGGAYAANSPINFTLNLGETYYVEWGGETYTCKAQSGILYGMAVLYIGNDSMLGGANSEPFTVGYFTQVGVVGFISADDKSSHDIRIYQKAQSVNVKPLIVTENGTYTAPEGEAYSPVTVSVTSSGSISMPLGYELKEILATTELNFEGTIGSSELFPQTPTVILADKDAVANVETISNGESGLVVWDGQLYAVYAGKRKMLVDDDTLTVSIDGSIGNIGIPSVIGAFVVATDTKEAGASTEPFLIVANTYYGFQVAIPEGSAVLTHTLQIYKFIKQ